MLPPSFPRRASEQHEHQAQDRDAPIRQTDSDAAIARLSAVQKRYLHDPFIQHLIPKAHLQLPRPALINIGTFVRSEAIDQLVDQWLSLSEVEGSPCQIVSLGAGSDTRFWRIATGPHKNTLSAYIELDFAENTTKKAMAIRRSKELSAQLEDVKLAGGGTTLHSRTYHLLPVDLRAPPAQSLAPVLASPPSTSTPSLPLLSPSLPTLLLFECVLVYMSPQASTTLIQWFVDYFANSGVLGSMVYEMFGLGDSFGKVMVNNLKSRSISLPGADPYPTLSSLPNRFTQHQFTTSHALTLREIRRSYIPKQELARITTLEMLDEIEELELVLQHYAITWGTKNPNDHLKARWKDWGLKVSEDPTLDQAD